MYYVKAGNMYFVICNIIYRMYSKIPLGCGFSQDCLPTIFLQNKRRSVVWYNNSNAMEKTFPWPVWKILGTSNIDLFSVLSKKCFIFEMEWVPFKSPFWNASDLFANFMISVTRGVSLWCRTCLKDMLNSDNGNKYRKFTTV